MKKFITILFIGIGFLAKTQNNTTGNSVYQILIENKSKWFDKYEEGLKISDCHKAIDYWTSPNDGIWDLFKATEMGYNVTNKILMKSPEVSLWLSAMEKLNEAIGDNAGCHKKENINKIDCVECKNALSDYFYANLNLITFYVVHMEANAMEYNIEFKL